MEYDDVATDEELLVTTEDTNTTENTTALDDNDENNFNFDKEIPAYLDDKKSDSLSDDIIELNVGGQRITTLRSTLTVIPNSKLALLFAKDNKTENKSKQKKTYFFDYNPKLFQHLLDQLRTMKRKPLVPLYDLDFIKYNFGDVPFDYSNMLVELGLTRKLNSMRYHKILSFLLF